MLNGTPTLARHDPSKLSSDRAESLGSAASGQNGIYPHDRQEFQCPAFVAVSAALRRLLLQAEIAGPRLQCATLEGEAGTGKHLLAQNLHRMSPMARLPFHRHDAREWLASEADVSTLTGTLYLDRVDLLAPAGQGLLLHLVRTLQNTTMQNAALQNANAPPQPSSESARFGRFLLLVSAHASLRTLAGQGQFLPDLAFRLSAVRFQVPPLREHREDIAPIAQTLIERVCRRYQQPAAVLAAGTLPRLLQHSWPGNVRELASILESAILDSSTGVLRPADFALAAGAPFAAPQASSSNPPVAAPASATSLPHDLSLDTMIRRHIQLVLDLNRGNKLRAARQLGISRSTLYRLLAGETIGGKGIPEEPLTET
jgi:DNA-binding NtrC family response regulator